MKIFSDTKIYVTCPGNSRTGGPELLHQLCSLLLQYGLNAQMFYTSGNHDNPVHEVYDKYHLPYVWKVEDHPHNVLIFYEVVGDLYYKYNRVQKIFWWLSVDNYLVSVSNTFAQFTQKALTKSLPKFFFLAMRLNSSRQCAATSSEISKPRRFAMSLKISVSSSAV